MLRKFTLESSTIDLKFKINTSNAKENLFRYEFQEHWKIFEELKNIHADIEGPDVYSKSIFYKSNVYRAKNT